MKLQFVSPEGKIDWKTFFKHLVVAEKFNPKGYTVKVDGQETKHYYKIGSAKLPKKRVAVDRNPIYYLKNGKGCLLALKGLPQYEEEEILFKQAMPNEYGIDDRMTTEDVKLIMKAIKDESYQKLIAIYQSVQKQRSKQVEPKIEKKTSKK